MIEMVRAKLPLTARVASSADAWQLVGPALIARQTGALEAIFTLRPLGRDADATVLLRSLYDHAVTFAWLAANPGQERHRRFLKSDLQRRIDIAKDCRKLKHKGVQVEVATDVEQEEFERQLAELPEGTKAMPDLIDRAEKADLHWAGVIDGLAGSTDADSYRGFYAIAYRGESAIAHATMMGLNPVYVDLPDGRKRVQLEERDPYMHGPFGRASLLFGLTLLVAANALEWPERDAVLAIFAAQ
jgi:Family of unknown function (DUF5677)